MKRQEIVAQIEGWILDMETQSGDRRTGRAISLNAMALKVHFITFLISSFRHVLYVVCFLLGNSPVSGVYMPTFWNTLSVPSS